MGILRTDRALRHIFLTAIKHTLIYGFGTVGYRLAGFLLLPLYTAKIPPSQYGVYGILEVLEQIIVGVFSFGLPTALFKWLACAADERDRIDTVSTTLWLVVLGNLAVLAPLAIAMPLGLSNYVAGLFVRTGLGTEHFLALGFVFCLDVLTTAVVRLLLNVLRAEEKPGWYTGLSLARFIAVLGLNVWFVGSLGLGIVGIFLGQVCGSILVFVFLVFRLSSRIRFAVRREWVSPMLRYGGPLALVAVIVLVLNLGNRFFVQALCGPAELGRFTFGQKVGNILYVAVVQPFTFAYFPLMWKTKDTNPNFMGRALTYFLAVALWIVLGFALFAPELTRGLARSEAYYAAEKVIPVVALGSVAYGATYLLQSSFYLSGRTQWIAVGYGFGVFVNVVFNLLAIPRWGIVASAWSVVVSYGATSLFSYAMGKKCYPIAYEPRRIGLALAGVGGILVLSRVLDNFGSWVQAAVNAFFWALYPIVLFAAGFVTTEERRSMITQLRRIARLPGWA